VVVDDVGAALRRLAEAWRARFAIPFVAVTGSNGKTTTKALVAHLARGTFAAYAAPENYNTEIGLPLALLGMPRETELAVFELGADRPGDISLLARLLRPSVGLVTSVGPSHLEAFGTTAAVAEEKWNLVRLLEADGCAFANADSPELLRLAAAEPREGLVTAGIEHGTVRGRILSAVPHLALALDEPPLQLDTALLGEQNATNVLLAALCALHLGVPARAIEERARTFRPIAHRMEARPAGFGQLVDDVYNANPASMSAALRVVARLSDAPEKRAVVFGDMLGLGSETARLHRDVARLALGLPIGRIYPVGELSRAAFSAERDDRVVLMEREAIARDLTAAWAGASGAAVLVKGSRGMKLETVVEEILRLAPAAPYES
jgi:UDP-N-acetylmuramoyl-tripeptide--D-alanyl-D-alanine ligase